MEHVVMNSKALEISKKLTRLQKRLSKLSIEIHSLELERIGVCIHNSTEIESSTFEGNYLNRTVYVKKEICKDCGKVLETKIETGGFA